MGSRLYSRIIRFTFYGFLIVYLSYCFLSAYFWSYELAEYVVLLILRLLLIVPLFFVKVLLSPFTDFPHFMYALLNTVFIFPAIGIAHAIFHKALPHADAEDNFHTILYFVFWAIFFVVYWYVSLDSESIVNVIEFISSSTVAIIVCTVATLAWIAAHIIANKE